VRKLTYIYPVLELVGFCVLYTWMNVSKRLFVDYWGCGCPRIDGSWPLINTNRFTMLLLALAAAGAAVPCWAAKDRFSPKARPYYLGCCGAAIVVVCLFTFRRNLWF
jgi:hypothetical protein